MIENIERIGAKLEADALGNLRLLLARDIDVSKTRTEIGTAGDGSQAGKDDWRRRTRLSRWILEAASRNYGKRRSYWTYRRLNKRHVGSSRLLNPLDRSRGHKVRTNHSGHTRIGRGVIGNRDRIAGLVLHNAGELVAFDEPVSFERNSINHSSRVVVPGVEVRRPIIVAGVVAVLERVATLRAERISIERLRPVIVHIELQPMTGVLACSKPHGVIVRRSNAVGLRNIYVGNRFASSDRAGCRESREWTSRPPSDRLVLVGARPQMFSNRTIVARRKHDAVRPFLLKVQIEALDVGIAEVAIS